MSCNRAHLGQHILRRRAFSKAHFLSVTGVVRVVHAAPSSSMSEDTDMALARKLQQIEAQMHEPAKNLEFEDAAALRDQLAELRQQAFVT